MARSQPVRWRYTSSPCKRPASARLSTSLSSQTAWGAAAAKMGTAHLSNKEAVAASGSPRWPKYRAACFRSMVSGFSSASGRLGPMDIAAPPSFFDNSISIQQGKSSVNEKCPPHFIPGPPYAVPNKGPASPPASFPSPKFFQTIFHQPIDNLGKWGYNAAIQSTNLVGFQRKEGTTMTLIWKNLLHANFRCGRMYSGRAENRTSCCALPSGGRMCPEV